MGQLDEVCVQKLINGASVGRVYMHGHEHELLQLLSHVVPDRLLEVEELFVPLIRNATGNEQVEDGAERPHVSFRIHLVGF